MPLDIYNTPLPAEHSAIKSGSQSAKAFRLIARKILYPTVSEGQDKEAYALVFDLLGINKLQADLLALFLTRRIGVDNCRQFERFLPSVDSDAIRAEWQNLQKKELILNEGAENLSFVYFSPNEDLVHAIIEDRSIGEVKNATAREGFCSAAHSLIADLEDENEPSCWGLKDESKTKGSYIERVEKWLVRYPGTPFCRSVRRVTASLSKDERLLLYALIGFFVDRFTTPVNAEDFSGRGDISDAFMHHRGSLIEKGLMVSVYVWNRHNQSAGTENYRISPQCAAIFKGYESLIKAQVLVSSGSYIRPGDIREKELIFPDDDTVAMNRIRRAAGVDEYGRILAKLKEHDLRPCLSVLMYGPPGTGKTELARQIAREAGRALLIADASKLTGIYIGETPMNFRELFQNYRYVCAISNISPILFMDEADGVLGKRIRDVQRIGDKETNTVQDIILEELNSLPGIFFATTNLMDNLDDALLRRFLLKAEFHLPDTLARARLWLSKFPSLSPDAARRLAEEFCISGGQIDNVVSTAIMDEILDGDETTEADLVEYCKAESKGKGGKRNMIGF